MRSESLVGSGSVAVSISACHAEGRGFKSRPDRQFLPTLEVNSLEVGEYGNVAQG